jgi:uncharacterized protein (TIGR02246 family)
MRTTTILIISSLLFLNSCDNTEVSEKNNSTNDSLFLIEMVHVRENAMKKKDISTVMAQFSDDATFINGEGYYLANKEEIAAFHKGLTQSDSIGYYYIAGHVHVRMLDDKNALVYYPNRMDWYNVSNPTDTIEKETRLMTLSAQKRNGTWQWVAITNQQTPEYFDDLTKHKINDLNEYLKTPTPNK